MALEAIAAAAHVDDPYLQYIIRLAIGFDAIVRGRLSATLGAAEEILALGRKLDDPRSISWGMFLKAFVASLTGDFARSLEFSEIGVNMARTPSDTVINEYGVVAALVLLGRPEAQAKLEEFRSRRRDDGSLFFVAATGGHWGVALAIRGNLGAGIGWIEASIARSEEDGPHILADQSRLMLCEIYLRMVSRTGKPSLRFLVRNLGTSSRRAVHRVAGRESRLASARESAARSQWPDHRPMRDDPRPALPGQEEARARLATSDRGEADRLAVRSDADAGPDRRSSRGVGVIKADGRTTNFRSAQSLRFHQVNVG